MGFFFILRIGNGILIGQKDGKKTNKLHHAKNRKPRIQKTKRLSAING